MKLSKKKFTKHEIHKSGLVWAHISPTHPYIG